MGVLSQRHFSLNFSRTAVVWCFFTSNVIQHHANYTRWPTLWPFIPLHLSLHVSFLCHQSNLIPFSANFILMGPDDFSRRVSSLITRPSHCPSFWLHCKQSKSGQWEGLRTRLDGQQVLKNDSNCHMINTLEMVLLQNCTNSFPKSYPIYSLTNFIWFQTIKTTQHWFFPNEDTYIMRHNLLWVQSYLSLCSLHSYLSQEMHHAEHLTNHGQLSCH